MNKEAPLILSPYAHSEQIIHSPRYRWNCSGRGEVPFVIFQFSLEGAGCFSKGNRTHEVPAGSAFISLVPEEAVYFYPPESRAPWRVCWINFMGEWSLDLWGKLRDRFGPVVHVPPDSAVVAQLLRFIRKTEARQFADRYEASAEAYALYMNYWRELEQPRKENSDPVEEALRICRNHFRDPISVKELAAQCQLSREHFTRLFTERQGIAPAAYLRKQRLDAAAEMLVQTSLPVKEVALRTGFYSARHLTTAFERAFLRTPQKYRQAARPPASKK